VGRAMTAKGNFLSHPALVMARQLPLERLFFCDMATAASPVAQPGVKPTEQTDSKTGFEPGFFVICWNDPINLMDYVTHVFQQVFGWERERAEKHMLEVHNKGKSVLTRESLEKAEFYVHELQKYNLHATMERNQ
jgi:ATP-dependent Clp protease adaptor protein ClpS